MEQISITIIIAIIGVILSVTTFFIGQKKSSQDDGQKFGEFIGEIRADIRNIKEDINELKRNGRSVNDAIREAIEQHERTFHNK